MNQTENYQLPQWEAGDTIKREDFNDLAARTDAALGDLQTAVAGAASFVTGSYSGNGRYPRDINLEFRPSAIVMSTRTGMTSNSTAVFGGVLLPSSPLANSQGTVAQITDTGFRLVAAYSNDSTAIYNYIAFR